MWKKKIKWKTLSKHVRMNTSGSFFKSTFEHEDQCRKIQYFLQNHL